MNDLSSVVGIRKHKRSLRKVAEQTMGGSEAHGDNNKGSRNGGGAVPLRSGPDNHLLNTVHRLHTRVGENACRSSPVPSVGLKCVRIWGREAGGVTISGAINGHEVL